MLRFLSNYLFQNENQPENDPTTISNSEEQGPRPKRNDDDDLDDEGTTTRRKEESMDFVEGERSGESDGDEEDDWVLIGEGQQPENKPRGVKVETVQVQVQPVSLVAAPSEEEDEKDGDEDEEEEDDDEDEDEEEEEEQAGNLLWENKLIEHPSMSVYVDLATSINSNNGVSSCVSLSSIGPVTSPGESVIVIEGQDSDDDDSSSSDEDMDIVEVAQPEVKASLPPLEKPESSPESSMSDMENNNNFAKKSSIPAAAAANAVQNGRRKKGHYPCSSSNSSQLPRRAHLRSSAGGNNRNNQTFQMISSNSWSSNTSLGSGQTPDTIHDSTMKRKRPSNAGSGSTATTAANGNAATVSACGIGIVGGAPNPPNSSTMINKNLKLVEMFPTSARSCKRRQRGSPPQNGCTHPKGHFLQESRRRQDLQNSNKRAYVNNDRRSAQQRRVQKGGAAAGGAGARSK